MKSLNPEAKSIVASYYGKKSDYWEGRRKKLLLRSLNLARQEIVAYKKFFNRSRSRLSRSKTPFSEAPEMSKTNYFRKYALPDLLPPGYLKKKSSVATATSGSTGEPAYFLRDHELDWQYSVLAEFFLQNGPGGSTLFIDCFGMGVWIGGLITYQAFYLAGLRGQSLSIITPGVNKKEIYHALTKLAPSFDNVIIAGYPPFIKDIVDEAPGERVDFRKFRTRLLFAAEGFSETFRDLLCSATGVKSPFLDTLNIYGSAELGAMAFETPTSILLRRLCLGHPQIYSEIFEQGRTPTLAQYNPDFVCFEEHAGRVLISAPTLMPFCRYDIGDHGGVASFEDFNKVLKKHKIDLGKFARKEGFRLTELPFVWVYERSDFSTKLYGAIIYPDPIRSALQEGYLQRFLTGKFFMETKYDSAHNQFLEIQLELKPGAVSSQRLMSRCRESIVKRLLHDNAEYRNNYSTISKKVTPRLRAWSFGNEKYFKAGGKQKWVAKK